MCFIDELLNNSLTNEGYKNYLKFIYCTVYKKNWPTSIVKNATSNFWNQDYIEELAQDFFVNVIQKNKNYLSDIPENIRYKMLEKFLSNYVADVIGNAQLKIYGITYRKARHTTLDILNSKDSPFKKITIENETYWYHKSYEKILLKEENEIIELFNSLPIISINNELSKIHTKKIIKNRITEIFEKIESPIDEELLINLIFNTFKTIFMSPSYFLSADEDIVIYQENILQDSPGINKVVSHIISQLDDTDKKILKEYTFNKLDVSIREAADITNIPRSTISLRDKKITAIIQENFKPKSMEEAKLFLDIFRHILDKMKI